MAEDVPSPYPLAPVHYFGPNSAWTSIFANQIPAFILPIATAVLFLLAWQGISVLGHISPTILTPPTMVLKQLTENFSLIMKHTYPTTIETLIAFGISIPLGIALAARTIQGREHALIITKSCSIPTAAGSWCRNTTAVLQPVRKATMPQRR